MTAPTPVAAAATPERQTSPPERCGWPETTSLASAGPNQESVSTVRPNNSTLSAPPASSVSVAGKLATKVSETDAINASRKRRMAEPATQPSGRSATQDVPLKMPQG